MNAESTLFIEIWQAVRDLLPGAKRGDAAAALLSALVDYGFDASDLRDVPGEDDHLTAAFEEEFADELEDAEEGMEDDEDA